jgi:hypothetical protein
MNEQDAFIPKLAKDPEGARSLPALADFEDYSPLNFCYLSKSTPIRGIVLIPGLISNVRESAAHATKAPWGKPKA